MEKNIQECKNCITQHFKKNEVILAIGDGGGMVGMLIDGYAHIVSLDRDGRETILECLESGDSFGEYFMIPSEKQLYNVIADTDCTVISICYDNVLNSCMSSCAYHSSLVKKLLLMTAEKVRELSFHVNLLSQRTLRNKLLMYLEYQSKESNVEDGEFKIPMTLVDLAEYLSVDRSAMMREIHNMNVDGLIQSKGRTFRIL